MKKFSKEALAEHFKDEALLIGVLLEDGKLYSVKEKDTILKKWREEQFN